MPGLKGSFSSSMVSSTITSKRIPRLGELKTKASEAPQNVWKWAKSNPRLVKRIIKCAVTLAAAVTLTITPPLVSFHGKNPFLLGTTAIYLFPNKSVGGQIVLTLTAWAGFLSGLAYTTLVLFLATLVQDNVPHHAISPQSISAARRGMLWAAFVFGAFWCGYVRSKHPRLYLSIVFFMIVNMFALIRGISNFNFVVYRDYFYVMIIGGCLSMLISLCLWPEDHSEVLKGGVNKALTEARQVVLEVEKSLWSKGLGGVVDVKGLSGAVKGLGLAFRETDYEISLARVDARCLMSLASKLETLLDLVKVYNCGVRARPVSMPVSSGELDEVAAEEEEDIERQSAHTPECPSETNKRRAISFAFLEAVRIIDIISDRVQDAYTSKNGTQNSPPVDIAGIERNRQAVEEWLVQERDKRTDSDILGLQNGVGLEELAFIDLINSIILELLDTVYAAARSSNRITSTGKLRLFLPRRFRKIVGEEKGPILPTNSRPTTSAGLSTSPTRTEYDYEFESPPEPQDNEGAEVSPSEIVLLRPQNKWHTTVALSISRSLSSIKRSRHVKYAIKFAIVMGVLASPAFFGANYIWYEEMRAQWALISAMIAMETTRGMTFRTAGMKVCGAVGGGIFAFITMEISGGTKIWVNILLTFFPIGFLVGFLVNNPKWLKAGTVFALAFNIVIGVGQTSINHNTHAALARRLITLPIGLMVAMTVHVGIFPFHARAQLGRAIANTMDWLHHLLYAIELSSEFSPTDYSIKVAPREFGDVINQAKRRVRYANSLVPATRYEISLAGYFPSDRFEGVLDRLGAVLLLIVGETGILRGTRAGDSCIPVLVGPASKGMVEAWGREQLLASLCNDLLVLSHTLAARLYMPRHHSHSAIVLQGYTNTLRDTLFNESVTDANLADLGRLCTLVNEMNLLRDEIDSLIVQSRISPKAKDMFPEMVAAAVGSGCLSRTTTKSRQDVELGFSRAGTPGWLTPRCTTPAVGMATPRSSTSVGGMVTPRCSTPRLNAPAIASPIPRSPTSGAVRWGDVATPTRSRSPVNRSRSRTGRSRSRTGTPRIGTPRIGPQE